MVFENIAELAVEEADAASTILSADTLKVGRSREKPKEIFRSSNVGWMTDERKMSDERVEWLRMIKRVVVAKVAFVEHTDFAFLNERDGDPFGIGRGDDETLVGVTVPNLPIVES